jgi:lysyl-tRNA synthetase class 2
VDTPVRQPVIIPEKNIIPLRSGRWFLQASPELCMKRLLAAGCEKIFQICPCFRAEERGRLHLEEFLMLEWYRNDADYTDLMADCEGMLLYITERFRQEFFNECLHLPASSFYGDQAITLHQSSQRLTVSEAFNRYGALDMRQALELDRFEEILVEDIEPHLGLEAPAFLCDYPGEQASLAKLRDDDPAVAERFELYISGIELANGFSELTDAREQRRRFHDEIDCIGKDNRESTGMPEQFLAALESLDKAAGVAFGLDRLFMLMLGKKSLGESVTFAPSDF